MLPTCFDQLWIIFREEPYKAIMYKTRFKIKLASKYMMYLDILKSMFETELWRMFHMQHTWLTSVMG